MSALEDASALLADCILVDGHNDLPYAIREQGDVDVEVSDDALPDLDVEQLDLVADVPRMRAGHVGAQFWSVYVPSDLSPHQAVTQTLEQIDLTKRLVARHSDAFALATTRAEVEQAVASRRIASLIGMEGGHSIGGSLGTLRMMHELGARYMTLTHWDDTPWSSSATDVGIPGGLTEFGHEVVREMNRIGMLVDLSHVNTETMHAALDTTTSPVMFSHSSCRALVNHPRNVPDDVLGRLSQNGGVLMVTFVPPFVSAEVGLWERHHDPDEQARIGHLYDDDPAAVPTERPSATLEQVADHVDHAREVAGVDHVGIGSDFYDAASPMPRGLEDVSCFPALFAELMSRGWSDADLRKLAGENALRVLADAER